MTKNDRAAAIIDSLGEAAIVLDDAGVIVDLNQAAADMLDIDRDKIVGQLLGDDLERGVGYAKVRAALDKARTFAAGETRIELGLSIQGRQRDLLLKASSLRSREGASLGTLVLLQDLSENHLRSRAHEGAVAALAHELNTPLTSISLAVGLLQRSRERQNELMCAIVQDVDRLNHLSADFRTLTREQPRSITIRDISFDLGIIINIVTRKFEARIERRKILFVARAEEVLRTSGDPLMLSWVLATLVSNALRCAPDRGRVELTAGKVGDQIHITVWDNGPGIPRRARELAFENGRYSGVVLDSLETGLSLALAKEIVEAHGGRLHSDILEKGSSITLTLPLS